MTQSFERAGAEAVTALRSRAINSSNSLSALPSTSCAALP